MSKDDQSADLREQLDSNSVDSKVDSKASLSADYSVEWVQTSSEMMN